MKLAHYSNKKGDEFVVILDNDDVEDYLDGDYDVDFIVDIGKGSVNLPTDRELKA
jgi:hypothetical protein